MKRRYISTTDMPVSYAIDETKDLSLLENERAKYYYLKGSEYYDIKSKSVEKIIDIIIVPAGDSNAWRLYFTAILSMSYNDALRMIQNWVTETGPNEYYDFTVVCVLERKSDGPGYARNIFKNLGYVLGCIDVGSSSN